jgi:hypothetical protein
MPLLNSWKSKNTRFGHYIWSIVLNGPPHWYAKVFCKVTFHQLKKANFHLSWNLKLNRSPLVNTKSSYVQTRSPGIMFYFINEVTTTRVKPHTIKFVITSPLSKRYDRVYSGMNKKVIFHLSWLTKIYRKITFHLLSMLTDHLPSLMKYKS